MESAGSFDHIAFDGEITGLTRMAEAMSCTDCRLQDSTLRTIITHMKEAVILIDRDFLMVEINDAARDLLGLPQDARGMSLKRDVNVELRDGNGDPVPECDRIHNLCMSGKIVENHVHEMVFEDGTNKYFQVNGTPIRDVHGNVDMVLLAGRDVTETRKLQIRTERMLAEMKRQRASLKHLINNMPAGVILLDSELRVIGSNKTYSDYFDKPSKWRIGARLDEVLPMAEEAGIISVLRRALKRKRPVRVHDFRYDGLTRGTTYWSGAAVPIELPLEHGPVAAIALVTVEVTEEVGARERMADLAALAERRADELEAERARLNTIIESAPIPLLVYDANHKLVAHNSASKKLLRRLGVRDGYFTGDEVGFGSGIELLYPDGTPMSAGEGPFSRSACGEVVTDLVMLCRPRKGLTRALSFNSAPLKDSRGKVDGVVEAIIDVTEKSRTQEQVREVYRREHAIADKLQHCFLPTDLPEVECFELVERYRPALDEALVGGDFYDVFRLGEGEYGIVIGDVAGKGLKAAVYTAMTKYMLRAYALEESAPELVLARLNEALASCTPTEVFVTLVYAVLDCRSGVFVYANAGHEQPIFVEAHSGLATTLDVTGRALALAKGSSYTTHRVEMRGGDTIVLYTDGITDAGWGVNRLGQDRVLDILRDGASSPLQELADSVVNHALEFAGGRLSDDAALLLIRSLSKGL